MEDLADYSARYAQQYGSGSGWFERVLVAARREQVLATIRAARPRSVLEIGCGLEPLFAHDGGAEVSRYAIVEPVGDFCTHARALAETDPRVVAGSLTIEVREGFLEAMPTGEPTGAFDVVVLSSLLHEVPDPEALLRAVRARCTPATLVHVNVPNVRSFHRLLAFEMGLLTDLFEPSEMEKKFQRRSRYDRAALCAVLESEGFVVERFGTYFIKPFTHGQMEQLFDRAGFDRAMLDGLSRMAKHLPDAGAEMFAEVRLRDASSK